jgi:peptidoglycan/LPS O-acetylase OafA/YrhL
LPKYISYGFFILIILGSPYIIGHQGAFRQLTGLSIPFAASFFSPLFLLMILSIVMINNTFLATILSNRLFLILGASSYALYILQQPINKLLYQSIFPFSGISEEKNLLIFLIVEIILSIIVFYIIEIPGKTILKNIFQEKTRAKSWWKFWE